VQVNSLTFRLISLLENAVKSGLQRMTNFVADHALTAAFAL
jgi:hypothetical protein